MKNLYSYSIERDEYPTSPDEFNDYDSCFLVYDHRDFTVKVKGYEPLNIYEYIAEGNPPIYDGYFVFPVYAYIHSGVALSLGKNSYPFNDSFDTSMRGFALVKKDSEYTPTSEAAQKVAQALVTEWNDYLSGNVWVYQVARNGEIVDSCAGFYGDEGKEDATNQAKEIIKHHQKEELKSHINKLKSWLKNKVNFNYRKPAPTYEAV